MAATNQVLQRGLLKSAVKGKSTTAKFNKTPLYSPKCFHWGHKWGVISLSGGNQPAEHTGCCFSSVPRRLRDVTAAMCHVLCENDTEHTRALLPKAAALTPHATSQTSHFEVKRTGLASWLPSPEHLETTMRNLRLIVGENVELLGWEQTQCEIS